ncbi:2-phospho-L-lactate guanylyltransferase [Candidatus Nitrosocosmicus franklandus]|uniref:2-phospho-L-lactate guanylyltransferase n=1 Tax=Candidatus Nitrosocosmicus franklandianus TaxID=1798806 RepID=A0A484IF44_9ARCH|nr:2-phospho-L-lactate guanylyltransferase [Candidatus Nitrosocosmicus franklandus]VFJ14641.1 2-phospho-L-lactate guanylyltransferase [Candidatus Nitrosocosmicus franklandus]
MEDPKTAIIIPVKSFEKSKTRLSRYLTLEQRIELCRHFVNDLVKKVSRLERCQIIFITNEFINLPDSLRDKFLTIDEGMNSGVNKAVSLADSYITKAGFDSSLVIPIDIPLFNLSQINEILHYSKGFREGICIVPSYRYDGTNILLRKPHTVIETSYDDNSFFNHLRRGMEKGVSVKVFDFENLKTDVDTIEDIMLIFKKYVFTTSEQLNKVVNTSHQSNSKIILENNNSALNYLLEILSQNQDLWL